MEFTTYTLPNGIRGIHRRIKGNVTHCALLVNAGSRDELKNQFGLAHSPNTPCSKARSTARLTR